MADSPESHIRLQTLKTILSPEFQNADRHRIANTLKERFMKDPALLAEFERLLGSHGRALAEIAPTAEELKSFGWSDEEVVACPAAVVAAAAATWAAAAAQTVRQ